MSYVKLLEIRGALPKTLIRFVVRDPKRREMIFEYLQKGSGRKAVNIPRGEIQAQRVRGNEPVTITAHCGP